MGKSDAQKPREQLTNLQKISNQQIDKNTETYQIRRRMTTRGALQQEDGEKQEDKMQSINMENETQQGSPSTWNISGIWKRIQTLYL